MPGAGGAEAGREAFDAAGTPRRARPNWGSPDPTERRAKRCPSQRQGSGEGLVRTSGPEAFERFVQFGGQGRPELERLAGHRVLEREPVGVEERAIEVDRRRAARRRRRRRRPGGRSPRGARGSGGCGRSRGGSRAGAHVGFGERARVPRTRCAAPCPSLRDRHAGAPRGRPADRRVDRRRAALEVRPTRARRSAARRVRSTSCSTRPSYAGCERATTSSPLVSRSRRCTMPGRSGVADAGDLRDTGRAARSPACRRVAGAGMHHEPGRLGAPRSRRRRRTRTSTATGVGPPAARRPPARRAARPRSPASSCGSWPRARRRPRSRPRRRAPARRPAPAGEQRDRRSTRSPASAAGTTNRALDGAPGVAVPSPIARVGSHRDAARSAASRRS